MRITPELRPRSLYKMRGLWAICEIDQIARGGGADDVLVAAASAAILHPLIADGAIAAAGSPVARERSKVSSVIKGRMRQCPEGTGRRCGP